MPKSKVPKKRMFRDFSRQDKKYIKRNNLKRLKQMRQKVRSQWEISFSDLEFLLWGYDLQFFTIDYAAQDLEMNKPIYQTGLSILYRGLDIYTSTSIS